MKQIANIAVGRHNRKLIPISQTTVGATGSTLTLGTLQRTYNQTQPSPWDKYYTYILDPQLQFCADGEPDLTDAYTREEIKRQNTEKNKLPF